MWKAIFLIQLAPIHCHIHCRHLPTRSGNDRFAVGGGPPPPTAHGTARPHERQGGGRPLRHSDISELFDRLVVPLLEDLELEAALELDVAGLVERSGCSIATLGIDGSRHRDPPDALIVEWLSFMPDLKSLTLYNVNITGGLVYRLTLFGEGDEVASDEKGAKEEDKMDIDGDDEEVVSAEGGVDVPGTSDDEEEPEVVVVDDNEFGDDHDDGRDLCPLLKYLTLQESDYDELFFPNIVEDFVDMLRSRMCGVTGSLGKVTRFCTVDCDMEGVAQDAEVEKWIRHGVNIRFH